MTELIPSPLCTKKLQLFDDKIDEIDTLPFSLNNYNATLNIREANESFCIINKICCLKHAIFNVFYNKYENSKNKGRIHSVFYDRFIRLYTQLLDTQDKNIVIESNANIRQTYPDQIFNLDVIEIIINPITILQDNRPFSNQLYVIFLQTYYGNNIDQDWTIVANGIISTTQHETLYFPLKGKQNMLTQIDIHIVFIAKNEFDQDAVITINKHCIFLLK